MSELHLYIARHESVTDEEWRKAVAATRRLLDEDRRTPPPKDSPLSDPGFDLDASPRLPFIRWRPFLLGVLVGASVVGALRAPFLL